MVGVFVIMVRHSFHREEAGNTMAEAVAFIIMVAVIASKVGWVDLS